MTINKNKVNEYSHPLISVFIRISELLKLPSCQHCDNKNPKAKVNLPRAEKALLQYYHRFYLYLVIRDPVTRIPALL